MNAEQNEFLNASKTALSEGSFKRLTFSAKGKGDDKLKVSFDLVQGGKKRFVKYSSSVQPDDEMLPYEVDLVWTKINGIPSFRAATLCTTGHDLIYSENRKGVARLQKAKPSMKNAVQDHNRQKNYVLKENRSYLNGLGITSDKGQVIKKQYGKFRQIANFVEIIDRDIGQFVATHEEPISILDLGCGKGYLTFATYDFVRSRAQNEPQAIGIDIKTNVIDLCNNLSAKLGFDGLEFRNAKIQPTKPEPVDILIALHACDTATDDALALGLRSEMKFLFCAPCCQAEIAAQMGDRAESGFGLVNNFPLMRRRQADIITDVCRALLLNACGYDVKFLEFTALEHTLKNVMLAGKIDPKIDRERAYADYKALKADYGFKHHSLEENIRDLLPA